MVFMFGFLFNINKKFIPSKIQRFSSLDFQNLPFLVLYFLSYLTIGTFHLYSAPPVPGQVRWKKDSQGKDQRSEGKPRKNLIKFYVKWKISVVENWMLCDFPFLNLCWIESRTSFYIFNHLSFLYIILKALISLYAVG